MSSTLSKFYSHPNKLYITHISNMLDEGDSLLERSIKLYHDIAKLKSTFQQYIITLDKSIKNKNHTLLSGYIFLINNELSSKELIFGALAIFSHHKYLFNLLTLKEDNIYIGENFSFSKELEFFEEVVKAANSLDLYQNLKSDKKILEKKAEELRKYLKRVSFKESFSYKDFIEAKALFASLIYSDKYEAIFNIKKEPRKKIPKKMLSSYIDNLPFNKKRDEFRRYVLSNFDKQKHLFTLTAPTGYGKTLSALEFALQFEKEKIIFALPFTSIIDQTTAIMEDIFKESDIDIFKVHHKAVINEDIPNERYSKIKFLMNSFSGEINITTLYQLVFALFGNGNSENVKFNQFKNAVIIVDEAQAIPYELREDFIKLCEIVSEAFDTIFILMSATMPIVSSNFYEISNLEYFKNQNRYYLTWLNLENGEDTLREKISQEAQKSSTLVVVNTIKKAQELYLYFKDKFECYCLNGYMSDRDKQRVISEVKDKLKTNEKVLLISTQSIEAGVDLDFDIGFREVAPISSIIQSAGRVNRNFKKEPKPLYVFEDISGYSDLIYGDLQLISKTIFEILKEKDIYESNILEISRLYFKKINVQLEGAFIEKEIKSLAFEDINKKIQNTMEEEEFKEFIVIEPYSGFAKEIEKEIFELEKKELDKFTKMDQFEKIVKKLSKEGVSISKNDIKNFTTNLELIRVVNILYLPFRAPEYSIEYGVKKVTLETQAIDLGFD